MKCQITILEKEKNTRTQKAGATNLELQLLSEIDVDAALGILREERLDALDSVRVLNNL